MLGRHHLSLSVGTVALVALPLFPLHPHETLLIFTGTAIGSLVPDADSPDAAIFHDEVKGLSGGYGEILNAIAILNPVFGYTTKYLIYKPAVKFYDKFVFGGYDIAERHRGFLHSFLGLGTVTFMTTLYLIPVIIFLDLVWILGLGVFVIAFLSGAILHLLEDSCTKSGIQWNFPFQSWKLKGQITTTAKPEDMKYQRYFLTILGIGAAGMFFTPVIIEEVSPYYFSIVGFVVAVILWLIFSKGVAKCRIHPS